MRTMHRPPQARSRFASTQRVHKAPKYTVPASTPCKHRRLQSALLVVRCIVCNCYLGVGGAKNIEIRNKEIRNKEIRDKEIRDKEIRHKELRDRTEIEKLQIRKGEKRMEKIRFGMRWVGSVLREKALKKEKGIDGILVTVGLCIIALLLCVVMKDSLTTFIKTLVDAMTVKAQQILTGVAS